MNSHKREAKYKPTGFEKTLIGVFAVLFLCVGLYLVGPWYLDTSPDGAKAPLIALFNSFVAVKVYGGLLIADGLFLSTGVFNRSFSVRIVANAVLAGFLLRLYALIGVFLTIDSWRPPTYASHAVTVILLGALWLWIRWHERTAK